MYLSKYISLHIKHINVIFILSRYLIITPGQVCCYVVETSVLLLAMFICVEAGWCAVLVSGLTTGDCCDAGNGP